MNGNAEVSSVYGTILDVPFSSPISDMEVEVRVVKWCVED